MESRYGASPLRERYNQTVLTRETARELSGFKSQPVNFKLGFWDPRVNGVRYLKALIYNLAAGLSADNWDRLRRIKNRDVGDPIVVTYDGEQVCVDYLQAVLELEFIGRGVDLAGARVLEIGGGYGRTCHALVSNHDVHSYRIVDLANSLELARGYLRRVLDPALFAKVAFITPDELDALPADEAFDLTLSVNSFAEMPPDTVRNYLALADARSRFLYVRDTVGKYLDSSLDGHSQGRELVDLAMSTGLLRDVVDIHDSRAVAEHARTFVAAYRPGPDWACVGDAWARPWSFYWQALYANRRIDGSGGAAPDGAAPGGAAPGGAVPGGAVPGGAVPGGAAPDGPR
jgi:putative sugar O-methyltransferase